MSVPDSRDTTAQQMLDLARRHQREVAELRNALADEQDRRRKTQGELNMLRERLTCTLDRLDADGITNVDHVIHTIRKELES